MISMKIFIERYEEVTRKHGISAINWNGQYFNTGVFVASRETQHLFKPPLYFTCGLLPEQDYFNYRIIEAGINPYKLSIAWNRMIQWDKFELVKQTANFIHYAGSWGTDEMLMYMDSHIEYLVGEGLLSAPSTY